ncbi:unnamed protein product, partial [Absidia cylindrospora]
RPRACDDTSRQGTVAGNTRSNGSASRGNQNWPMVKEWLLEFPNTPKQRVKNTIGWMELAPKDNETGEDFIHRVLDSADAIELEKTSLATLTFFGIFVNFSPIWKNKIMDAIRDTNTTFIDKSFTEMCSFVSDLELNPIRFSPNGRSCDNNNTNVARTTFSRQRNDQGYSSSKRSFRNSNNRSWIHPKPVKLGAHPDGGIYCGEGCGQQYMPGHICGRSNNNSRNNRQGNAFAPGPSRVNRPLSRAARSYARVVQEDDINSLARTFRGNPLNDDSNSNNDNDNDNQGNASTDDDD